MYVARSDFQCSECIFESIFIRVESIFTNIYN